MRNRRLITTNYPRKPYRPDIWCHGFAKFLGRALTPFEKAVISAIERQRRHHARPMLVIDPPGQDSSALLARYLDYRLATSPPAATAFLCTPRKPARVSSLKNDRRITRHTYRHPERMRGHTPAFMLLLNAHQAKTFSPYSRTPENFRRLCSTLFPILDAYGFLIIHMIAGAPPPIAEGIMLCPAHPPEPPPDPPPVTVITIAPPQSHLLATSGSLGSSGLSATSGSSSLSGSSGSSSSLALLGLLGLSGLLSSPSGHPPSVSRYAVLRRPKPNRTASGL